MEEKNVLRTLKIVVMILVLSMFSIPFVFGASSAPWADSSELYRQEINITGASSSIDNLTHTFVINSGNVGANFDFTNDYQVLNYSVSGVGDYYLGREFVVSLD